mmetsp:Transcript_18020/g.39394  ORF Transcript_18020/g.39394 Transcript_18020/m.39394 type:complete len:212 (+) Transcript_18020:69-704(+)
MANVEDIPFIVEDRRMLSRVAGDRIKITHTIEPGRRETGCITCCHAPDNCPILASFLCCYDYPEYIVNEMNASRYIYVRENGIEWNSPSMQPAKGTCCGQSCTELAVMDNITVLYFDDINFDDVRNDTRCCNTCMTFCCGGRGEQVQIESTFCFSCCIRGRDNRTCIPVCCPDLCCPCIVKSELWVEDAPAAVKIIRDARDDAKRRLGLDD